MKNFLIKFGLYGILIIGLLQSCTRQSTPAPDKLVLIKDYIPHIDIVLKYATAENFTDTILYPSDSCWLAYGAVQNLILVEDSLNKIREYHGKTYPEGIGLRIWDGFRPISVQYKMWEIVPDSRYVADPSKGSSHNRGGAVDVTLINKATGEELAMPTGFDFFGEEAHHSFQGHNEEILNNRELLRNVMKDVGGFSLYEEEWWHYKFPPSDAYPLRDWKDKHH
jgi:D-alanyl-D-alanine dipeptidase